MPASASMRLWAPRVFCARDFDECVSILRPLARLSTISDRSITITIRPSQPLGRFFFVLQADVIRRAAPPARPQCGRSPWLCPGVTGAVTCGAFLFCPLVGDAIPVLCLLARNLIPVTSFIVRHAMPLLCYLERLRPFRPFRPN